MIKEKLELFFAKNKYTHWYLKIIEKANKENRIRTPEVYYENHHIIPASICREHKNLKLNAWNGVLLTSREHFVCHWLLTKMTKNDIMKRKMQKAFSSFLMDRNKKRILSSLEYQIVKEAHIKSLIGVKRKPEHVKKWQNKMKGRPLSDSNIMNLKGKNKGKIIIHNLDTLNIKRINPELLPEFEQKNYIKGVPEWLKEKWRENNRTKKGDKMTPEQREKLSFVKKELIKSGKIITSFQQKSRKCSFKDKIYHSMKEMSEDLGVSYDTVIHRLNSKTKRFEEWKFL